MMQTHIFWDESKAVSTQNDKIQSQLISFPGFFGLNNAKMWLVGGFNPFEKYVRQIESSPQVGPKNIFETIT